MNYIETIRNPEGEPEGYYYNVMQDGSALHGDGPFESHEAAFRAGQEYLRNHHKGEPLAELYGIPVLRTTTRWK